MPQFVNNLGNLVVDDQYFREVPVAQGASNVPTGNIGMVATFSRGPLNTPVTVSSYQQLVKQFGEVDAALTLTGTLEARAIFAQGNVNLTVVRIESSATKSAAATVILKDTQPTPGTVMTLNAETNGTWGNSLVAIVSAGTITGTFKVVLQYGNETETWDNLVIQQPTTPIAGAVLASTIFGAGGKSNLATATFPGTANTNPWAVGTFAFTGGLDGAATAPTDYIGANSGGVKTGIYALDGANVNIVLAAGQSDPTINNALLTTAQSVRTNGGTPRTAVITFPKGTAVSGLGALLTTAAFDTDLLEAAYPWQQVYEPVTGTTIVASPLGFFAGRLAQLAPHQSPGNKPLNGTLGADPSLNIGPGDIATMAGLQVNVVGVATPAGPLGIRGGFNLSKSGDNQIYARRMKDYIDQLVYSVGGQFVDLPITEDLMRQVRQTVDNILFPMKNTDVPQDQMIADYVINCSATNNPPTSIAQGRLICDYAVKLLNIDRFMIFQTQIGSGVVINTLPQQ